MRVVIQRVSHASCTVEDQLTGSIETGYCLFVGFCDNDDSARVQRMAQKILKLRIFSDAQGKMNLDLCQVQGSVLSISQFTLYASCRKGNRPSFTQAARPELAIPLYEEFNAALAKTVPVATGIFGADMKIELLNDGPVTIVLDSEELGI